MTRSPVEVAAELGAALSEVATALYGVDSSGDLLFVGTQADGGNPPAEAALDALAAAWERYPLAKEGVDLLNDGLSRGDHATVDRQLGPAAVTLPDGSTTGLRALLDDLRQRVDAIAGDVGRMAEAARKAVAQLDAARAATEELVVRAGAVGAGDDPEITGLQTAMASATAKVAADPTAASDLVTLDNAVGAARNRVEQLERAQQGLPTALAAAAQQVDEIDDLVGRGARDRELAIEKIQSPVGLVDVAAGDGSDGLRPRLAQIRDQAASGAWEMASNALTAWQHDADANLARARQAAAANAAPVARRNELRGLLDAYRAKALAFGRDEDGRLARMHDAAKVALYTAPCDLDAAGKLVADYAGAVNAAARGGEG